MSDLSRRDAMLAAAAGAATASLAVAAPALGQAETARPAAFAGQHQPKPLRFDPTKLTGLSERLIRSHWENNYQGSVKALAVVKKRLADALGDKDMPAYVYN